MNKEMCACNQSPIPHEHDDSCGSWVDPMSAWEVNVSRGETQCPYLEMLGDFETKLNCRYREGHPGLHNNCYDSPAREDQSAWYLPEEECSCRTWAREFIGWIDSGDKHHPFCDGTGRWKRVVVQATEVSYKETLREIAIEKITIPFSNNELYEAALEKLWDDAYAAGFVANKRLADPIIQVLEDQQAMPDSSVDKMIEEYKKSGCDPECVDPKEQEKADYYGIPHDDTTCACHCHEEEQ